MITDKNIILVGPYGAGKTTIGKLVAQGLGREFIDSDQYIVNRLGVSKELIFEIEGEEGFRQYEINALKELTKQKNILLSTGGGSVLKPENRALFKKSGLVIYLEVSIAQQMDRTRSDDAKRPLLRAHDRKKRLEELQEQRQAFYAEIAELRFNTDERPPKAVAKDIIRKLESLK